MIRYVKHKDIDKQRWDECINNSANGLIYALSWYLDAVCPGWEALILDEYKAVMPLPVRKKLGVNYVFATLYGQQLGIFGNMITPELIEEFISKLPRRFRIIDTTLNEGNPLPPSLKAIEKTNQIIPLNKEYKLMQESYNRNCKRNIKKAVNGGLQVKVINDVQYFANFIHSNLKQQATFLSSTNIETLMLVTQAAIKRKKGEVLGVLDSDGNVYAMGSFLFYRNRLIFSVCASTPVGKKNQAMYLLVDHQIAKSASRFEIFDFSGSEIKGVNYFNSTFGAIDRNYSLLRINRLPYLVKVLTGKR